MKIILYVIRLTFYGIHDYVVIEVKAMQVNYQEGPRSMSFYIRVVTNAI